MAVTVMTVELGTVYHNSRAEGTMFQTAIWTLISLTPSLCMPNKNWWFLHFLKELLNFSFNVCSLAITFHMMKWNLVKKIFLKILSNAPLTSDKNESVYVTITCASRTPKHLAQCGRSCAFYIFNWEYAVIRAWFIPAPCFIFFVSAVLRKNIKTHGIILDSLHYRISNFT